MSPPSSCVFSKAPQWSKDTSVPSSPPCPRHSRISVWIVSSWFDPLTVARHPAGRFVCKKLGYCALEERAQVWVRGRRSSHSPWALVLIKCPHVIFFFCLFVFLEMQDLLLCGCVWRGCALRRRERNETWTDVSRCCLYLWLLLFLCHQIVVTWSWH